MTTADEYANTAGTIDKDFEFEDPQLIIKKHVKFLPLDIAKIATRLARYGMILRPAAFKLANFIFDRTIPFGNIYQTISYNQFFEGGISRHGERYCWPLGYAEGALKKAMRELEDNNVAIRWNPYPRAVTRYALNLLWSIGQEVECNFQEMWTPFDGQELVSVIVDKKTVRGPHGEKLYSYKTLPVPKIAILRPQHVYERKPGPLPPKRKVRPKPAILRPIITRPKIKNIAGRFSSVRRPILLRKPD